MSCVASNAGQRASGGPEFHIGVGINYGVVTVGNIGCEKKMNYTAFGPMADFASELEGATKRYHVKCIVSEMVQRKVKGQLACRLLDFVPLGGMGRAVRIFTVKKTVEGVERETWNLHNEGMEAYLRRDFAGAADAFERVCGMIEADVPGALMLERCRRYQRAELSAGWDGAEIEGTA